MFDEIDSLNDRSISFSEEMEFGQFDAINSRDEQCYIDDMVDDIVFGGRKRVCAYCHKPIKRNHKWFTDEHGMISHRDCDNPTKDSK